MFGRTKIENRFEEQHCSLPGKQQYDVVNFLVPVCFQSAQK